MQKRRIVLFAACAVLGFAAWLVFHSHGAGKVEAAPEPTASRVSVVEKGSVSHVLALAGQFQPYQVMDVHPKVSGFIRSINVDIGDRVHEGQTLAVLEVPELQAQLEGTVAQVSRSKDEITRAQHEVSAAEARYSALHADNDRLQQAAKAWPGLIAQQELDDALSRDLSAAAQVGVAKAALSAAQGGAEVARADNRRVGAMEDYTSVIAPIEGVGVNVNVPIFNGFLYSSEAKEAGYRAEADAEQTRDLRDQIVRDVHMAWLQANTAYQRISVTAELLKEAKMALQLAQTRYQLGLSSIVELSQAQLQQTTAAIDNTNAQYEYRLALATLNYQVGTTP